MPDPKIQKFPTPANFNVHDPVLLEKSRKLKAAKTSVETPLDDLFGKLENYNPTLEEVEKEI